MKQLILAVMLMFTLELTAFSGGDDTSVAPTPTTKREADLLQPITPRFATFEDEAPVDTVQLISKSKTIQNK